MKPPTPTDGPAPRLDASQRGPLVATRCYCGGGGGAPPPSQTQSADTNQIGVDGDGNITVDDTSGSVTITNVDPTIANAALSLAGNIARDFIASLEASGKGIQNAAAGLGSDALETATAINASAVELGTDALGTARDVAEAGLSTSERVTTAGLTAARQIGEAGIAQVDAYITGQNRFVQESLATARAQGESSLNTATTLAEGSNRIASAVAASQEQFVATASGQKTTLYVIGGALALGAAALLLTRPSK